VLKSFKLLPLRYKTNKAAEQVLQFLKDISSSLDNGAHREREGEEEFGGLKGSYSCTDPRTAVE
jgi:hypothetical protein